MYPVVHKIPFSQGDSAELTEIAPDDFCCPVCGQSGLSLMYPIEGREAWDHTICPQCFTEFGADDFVSDSMVAEGIGHKERWKSLREGWLAKLEKQPKANE